MKQFLLIALASLLSLPFASCSSTDSCTANGNFRIDYFSGGGFTGMQQGVTVSCEGWAKFWKKMPASERVTTDSVELSSDQIKNFERLLGSPEIFSYSNKFTGNYTSHLVIMKDIQSNDISFNSSDPPSNMPEAVKNLISEIKTITKVKD